MGLVGTATNRGKARRDLRALPHRLSRDRRGTTIIEFAFVAAPFAALLVAILQTSLTFFAQQNLETTTEQATRQLMTGAAQQSGMTAAQFKTATCAKLSAFMKCANLMIDVKTTTSFSGATTGTPTLTYDSSGNVNNSWQFAPGGPGAINVVRIMYLWPVETGPLGFSLSDSRNGKRLLMATAVFKTEPYTK